MWNVNKIKSQHEALLRQKPVAFYCLTKRQFPETSSGRDPFFQEKTEKRRFLAWFQTGSSIAT